MIKLIKDIFIMPFFVSGIDKFLLKIKKQFPDLSLSQKLERAKYARIYTLRDNTGNENKKEKPVTRDAACVEFLNK